MKKLLVIIRVVSMTIFVIFNYIPIKFAVKGVHNDNNALYCITEPKLGPNRQKWVAYKSKNSGLEHDLIFEINGNDPDGVLSDLWFDVKSWHKVGRKFSTYGLGNAFIIYYTNDLDDVLNNNILYAKEWDIVYPINRAGWRRFVTPKAYLSIYDFSLLCYVLNE